MDAPGTPGSSRTGGGLSIALQRKGQQEFEFNLASTKNSVLRALDDKANMHFKKFYNGPLFDRLLNTAMLYFTARFMLDWLVRAMERARKTHLEGYDPYVVALRISELEAEAEKQRLELSPVYSEIILKYSRYEKPQHDRVFFEALMAGLISILDAAFSKLDKRADIEAEIGHLFRSKHFNINHRRYQPARSVDTLSVKELYSIKHETTNRALNAKMLSRLHEKPFMLAVQVASVTNSPLVTQCISSPMVARAQAKDPAERNKLLKGGADGGSQAGARTGELFAKSAALHGVDVGSLRDAIEMGSLTASKDVKEEIGLVGEDKASGRRSLGPSSSMIGPESIGLPADDTFNYLALLKRYIMFGPGMGFNPSTTGPERMTSTTFTGSFASREPTAMGALAMSMATGSLLLTAQ